MRSPSQVLGVRTCGVENTILPTTCSWSQVGRNRGGVGGEQWVASALGLAERGRLGLWRAMEKGILVQGQEKRESRHTAFTYGRCQPCHRKGWTAFCTRVPSLLFYKLPPSWLHCHWHEPTLSSATWQKCHMRNASPPFLQSSSRLASPWITLLQSLTNVVQTSMTQGTSVSLHLQSERNYFY